MSLSQKLKRKLQNWLDITELQHGVDGTKPLSPKAKGSHGKGKVVAGGIKAEYSPGRTIQGGRIVKVMPRELKRIKEGQEYQHEL